jgi:hypothetical protein
VCTVDIEGQKDLQEKIKEAVAQYHKEKGNNVQVGRLRMGNYKAFKPREYWQSWNKAYHFAKFSFDNDEDNNALIDIKFLQYKETMLRFLPNFNFTEVEKKFENPKHNFVIKFVPTQWNHKDLYEIVKVICPQGNSVLASKVSMSFKWSGDEKDEPSKELIKAANGLSRSPEDSYQIDYMIEEFRKNGDYKVSSNKFGYVAFTNEITNEQFNYISNHPKIQEHKL